MESLFRIGYLSTLYHSSHLLRQLGWVEKELGLECAWTLYGTGPEMILAFQRSELDLGYIGLPPAMIGISKGIPLICVGGGHVEGTVMVAGPGYSSLEEVGPWPVFLEQFVHKRVGIPAAGSIHDVIFRALLAEHSLTEVEVVNFAWADLIPYALNRAEIQAAVGTPALAILCERESGTQAMIPPGNLWPFNPSYGIVIHRDMLSEGARIEGFLSLHEKACNLIRKSPDKGARITVEALAGMDEAFVKKVYAVSPRYCASLPREYREATLSFLPVLQKMGYLENPLGEQEIFETGFVRGVHTEPHHY